MNKKYNILLLVTVLFLPRIAFTQQEFDNNVIKAMQDELNRNKKELKLPDIDSPYFISYAIERWRAFKVEAKLGGIVVSQETPWNAMGVSRLQLGNYQRNSDPFYSGNFLSFKLPGSCNYDAIRRGFWLNTDQNYKIAIQNFTKKMSVIKNNPPATEYLNLPDFARIDVSKPYYSAGFCYKFDLKEWEDKIKELSSIFKNYNNLFNSRVGISVLQMKFYKTTSEGTLTVIPKSLILLYVDASVRTKDDVIIPDVEKYIALTPDQLPSLESLKNDIDGFAENLSQLGECEQMDKTFKGPILVEGDACEKLFEGIIGNAISSYRPPVNKRVGNIFEKKIGTKVVDGRLTIKNYSKKTAYGEKPLMGAYKVDAEGVVPADEITLIEEGKLKNLLNSRIPTPKCPKSTGSSRYLLMGNNVVFATAPGTIHIQAKKTIKADAMKKYYIKMLRKKRLKYGYIIRRLNLYATRIYKVDLKGNETQVIIGNSRVSMDDLMRLGAISDKERVGNFMLRNTIVSSIISPSAVIIKDIEISKADMRKSAKPVLVNPLMR